jgi:hypothetical protein
MLDGRECGCVIDWTQRSNEDVQKWDRRIRLHFHIEFYGSPQTVRVITKISEGFQVTNVSSTHLSHKDGFVLAPCVQETPYKYY